MKYNFSVEITNITSVVAHVVPVVAHVVPVVATINLVVDSDWGSGYNATLNITVPADIVNWKITCSGSVLPSWFSSASTTLISPDVIEITPARWARNIKANETISLTFGGTIQLSNFEFHELEASTKVVEITGAPSPVKLSLDPKRQIKIAQNTTEIIDITGDIVSNVYSNNTKVFEVTMTNNQIIIKTKDYNGRGCVKLTDMNGETIKTFGVVVGTGIDTTEYPIGMVSEDDPRTSIAFWQDFSVHNKRCESRYVYLNGGPGDYGWRLNYTTPEFNLEPLGKRVINFIRNSLSLGMIPTLVYYNIPAGGESYTTNNENLQNPKHMNDYFKDLEFLLDTINKENPDDITRIILEPDSIGYQMQMSGKKLSELPVCVDEVLKSGVLTNTDPVFPNTNTGLIQAINYIIHKKCPKVEFGWQINAWSNPVSIPGGIGICKSSDFIENFEEAKAFIKKTAEDTARYYLEGGIESYGASFFSIDKYGLEFSLVTADKNPIPNAWAFNNDHWNNYLLYAKSLGDIINLPCVLWQLPVGRLNGSHYISPYTNQRFPDMDDTSTKGQDSATTFFFGDTFTPPREYYNYWAKNEWNDPLISSDGTNITYRSHLSLLKNYGIINYLCGAGVGNSTNSGGNPISGVIPSDNYFCISKIQDSYKK